MINALKYKPIELEISAYIRKHPEKKPAEVLRYFEVKCGKSKATVERYLKNAREHAKSVLQADEKIEAGVRAEIIKEAAKYEILSKNELLSELTADFKRLAEIKSGAVFKDIDPKTGQVMGYRQADFGDEMSAKRARVSIGQQISKIQMWEISENDLLTPLFTERFIFRKDANDTSV